MTRNCIRKFIVVAIRSAAAGARFIAVRSTSQSPTSHEIAPRGARRGVRFRGIGSQVHEADDGILGLQSERRFHLVVVGRARRSSTSN